MRVKLNNKVNPGVVVAIFVLGVFAFLLFTQFRSGDLTGQAYTGVSNTPLISYSFDSLSGDRFIDEGTLGHDAVCQDTWPGQCPIPVEDGQSGGSKYGSASPSLWDFTQFYGSLLRVPRTDFGDQFTITFRAYFGQYTNGYILSNDINNAGGISVKVRGTSDITGAIEVLTTGNAGQITGAPVNEAPGFEGTVARTVDHAVAIGDYNGRAMISDVAIVVDRAAGTARIYVNGVDKTVDSAVATTFTTDNEWVIGGSPANSEHFDGYLDDLRIYPDVLTEEEVFCLAHADKLSCGDSTDANSNGYPDHHDLAVIRRLGTMDQLSAFVRYVHRYYDITSPIYPGGYGGTPDGRFTSRDTHAVGREQCDTASCDFNNDGVFNTADAEQINEMYVGLYDLNGDRIASGFEPYGFSGEYDANYAVSILEGRAPCIFDTGGSRGQITGAPVYEPDPVAISPGVVYCDITGDGVFDWNDHDAIANGESFVVPQEPVCGDSIVEGTEQCDDGNTVDEDGCSTTCQVQQTVCGNSVVESTEQCDDGNAVNGDGCTSICTIEPICGDGVVNQPSEECDDGNREEGIDSCNNICMTTAPTYFRIERTGYDISTGGYFVSLSYLGNKFDHLENKFYWWKMEIPEVNFVDVQRSGGLVSYFNQDNLQFTFSSAVKKYDESLNKYVPNNEIIERALLIFPDGNVPVKLTLSVSDSEFASAPQEIIFQSFGNARLRSVKDNSVYKIGIVQVLEPGMKLDDYNLCTRRDKYYNQKYHAGAITKDCFAYAQTSYYDISSYKLSDVMFANNPTVINVLPVDEINLMPSDLAQDTVTVYPLTLLDEFWENLIETQMKDRNTILGKNPQFDLVFLDSIEKQPGLSSNNHGIVSEFFYDAMIENDVNIEQFDFVVFIAYIKFGGGNQGFGQGFALGESNKFLKRASFVPFNLGPDQISSVSSEQIIFNRLFLSAAHELGHTLFRLSDLYDGFAIKHPQGVPHPQNYPQEQACIMSRGFGNVVASNGITAIPYDTTQPGQTPLNLPRAHTISVDNFVLCVDDINKIAQMTNSNCNQGQFDSNQCHYCHDSTCEPCTSLNYLKCTLKTQT